MQNAWWQCCSEQGTTEDLSPVVSSLHSVVCLKRNTKKIRPMSTVYIFRPGPKPQDAPLALDCSERDHVEPEGARDLQPSKATFLQAPLRFWDWRQSGQGTSFKWEEALPTAHLAPQTLETGEAAACGKPAALAFLAPTNGRLFPWWWAGGGGAGTP